MFSTLSKIEIFILATFDLLSANALSLDQAKILSFGKDLTHNHTIPHFDALKICSCGKHCEEGETACKQQTLLFSQCFPPHMVLIFHFKYALKCHLQFVSIRTSLKFGCLVLGPY